MNEQTKRLAEGLRTAILAEIEGQHFYRMAAQNTADEQGKEVFRQLAEEEVQHEKWLRQHYESLIATGEINLRKPQLRSTILPVRERCPRSQSIPWQQESGR